MNVPLIRILGQDAAKNGERRRGSAVMGRFTRDIPRMLVGGIRGAVAGCLSTLVVAMFLLGALICLIQGWWEHGSIAFAFDWQQSRSSWVFAGVTAATLAVCVATAAGVGGAFGRGVRYDDSSSRLVHSRAEWIGAILGAVFGGLGGAADVVILGAVLPNIDPAKAPYAAVGFALVSSLICWRSGILIAGAADRATFRDR